MEISHCIRKKSNHKPEVDSASNLKRVTGIDFLKREAKLKMIGNSIKNDTVKWKIPYTLNQNLESLPYRSLTKVQS